MARRTFLGTLAGDLLTAPRAAEGQPAAKVYRIGFLGNSTPALEANLVGPFGEGLRELGYVEGRNIVIEYRWAEGQYERFPVLIAELLVRKVIVTAGTLDLRGFGGETVGASQGSAPHDLARRRALEFG